MPSLKVIGSQKVEGVTLKQFIEEKRMLKTSIKVHHLLLLQQDINKLEQYGYTLREINLEDIIISPNYQFIVPLKDKIIPKEDDKISFRIKLIALSYLYNINLLTLYEEDQIKEIDHLLEIGDLKSYLLSLNNPKGRERQFEQRLVLKRSVNKKR